MQLRQIGGVLSFFIAFAIGITVAFTEGSGTEVAAVNAPKEIPVNAPASAPLKMGMLVGKWAGKWDHDFADCTVAIDRVAGNDFYGTLTKNGASIAITGTLDRKTRKVKIHETDVLALGHYGMWSLGENTGEISADGLSMSGTGYDKWGDYRWFVSLEYSTEE